MSTWKHNTSAVLGYCGERGASLRDRLLSLTFERDTGNVLEPALFAIGLQVELLGERNLELNIWNHLRGMVVVLGTRAAEELRGKIWTRAPEGSMRQAPKTFAMLGFGKPSI